MSCPICLENLSNVFKCSGCSHAFHKECLRKWARVKATCPLCCVELEGEFKEARIQIEIDEVAVNLKGLEIAIIGLLHHPDVETAMKQIKILRVAREACISRLKTLID